MSALTDRLSEEIRAALKGGQKVRLGALRLLAASVKNREVELRRDLTDDEFAEVAVREVKRRREEMEVLQAYVPAGLSDDELSGLIDEGIAATAASEPGDLGKVMGFVMGRAKGRVDGRAVQEKVRERLT